MVLLSNILERLNSVTMQAAGHHDYDSTSVFGTAASIVAILIILRFFLLGSSVNIPIAIQDEIPSEKKRIEKYVFESRYVLVQGYNKVTKIDQPLASKCSFLNSSKTEFLESTRVKVSMRVWVA
jgi:hypothetical protein